MALRSSSSSPESVSTESPSFGQHRPRRAESCPHCCGTKPAKVTGSRAAIRAASNSAWHPSRPGVSVAIAISHSAAANAASASCIASARSADSAARRLWSRTRCNAPTMSNPMMTSAPVTAIIEKPLVRAQRLSMHPPRSAAGYAQHRSPRNGHDCGAGRPVGIGGLQRVHLTPWSVRGIGRSRPWWAS